jgi:hypothetical protein
MGSSVVRGEIWAGTHHMAEAGRRGRAVGDGDGDGDDPAVHGW